MSQWPPRSAVYKPFGVRAEVAAERRDRNERSLNARLRDVRQAISERTRVGQVNTPLVAKFKVLEAELEEKIRRLK